MSNQKKTVYHLRDEILLAHRFFRKVNIEADFIQCSIDYSVENIDSKKLKLKSYIQNTFDNILQVDMFSDYFVIWHHPRVIDKQHQTKRPLK